MEDNVSKIELLAPAGNEEALVTAVESACDAVYLGVSAFNARSRAKNFQVEQLPKIITFCHSKNVKVYVTLNTLIKNNEMSDLLKLAYKVVSANPDAIIIQDLSLFYILQKLDYRHIHFSTQAGIHNSIGVIFAIEKGAERAILARELTLAEVASAAQAGPTEIFIHGALCYSISGACLFSSYLGGMSANRGKCKQPCRRVFNLTKRKKEHLFSLKDLEAIDQLGELTRIGVKSLKIEGRMKRADYVSQVVKAYRLALDNPAERERAKEMLVNDFARSKTAYFLGGDVSDAITQQPFAGIFLAYAKVRANKIYFNSQVSSQLGDKIKVYYGEEDSDTYTITKILENNSIEISENLTNNDKVAVYKVSTLEEKPARMNFESDYLPNISKNKIRELTALENNKDYYHKGKTLFIRLGSLDDISSIPKNHHKVKYLLPLSELSANGNKIIKNVIWELPLFISEGDIKQHQESILSLYNTGYREFAISHISQLHLIPKRASVLANEHIYTLNDLAIKQIKEWGVSSYILPFENDIPNLNHYKHKDGIIPIFFTPALFTSRMPVKQGYIKDKKNSYLVARRGKLTYTYPHNPVAIFSFLRKLEDYSNYFLDFSTPNIEKEDFALIFQDLEKRKNPVNTSKFNFKKGLW